MIISCGTVLFRKHSLDRALDAIRRAGFEYFETQAIHPYCPHVDIDRDDPVRFASRAKELGFKGVTALWMPHGRLIADDESESSAVKSLYWCEAAGIKTLHVGDGMKDDKMDDETAFAILKARLERIVEVAEKTKTQVAIEPHGTFSLTAKGLKRILSIDRRIGVNYDPANIFRSSFIENIDGFFRESRLAEREDEVDVVREIADRIVFFHAKDIRDGQTCALGEGNVKVKECLEILHGRGYDGVVSLETNGESDFKTEFEIAKKGYGFLRQTIDNL
jgi:sugar phosphate isomerase/epimerase